MALEVVQGEDLSIAIDLRQANGRPYDLTGKDVIAQLKISGVVTNITCTIVSASLGQITLPITDVQSGNLATGDLKASIYVGSYAAPPVITPGTDSTDKIFLISKQITVSKVVT